MDPNLPTYSGFNYSVQESLYLNEIHEEKGRLQTKSAYV
jgi:hypothetical protein